VQSNLKARHVILTFAVTLLFYVVAYGCVEHLRHRKGPWEVAYALDRTGTPALTVNQEHLTISNLTLLFPGETAPSAHVPAQVAFDIPGRDGPFGKVIYEDLTFLPGVVTFNLFGHEIELLPRVLIVDKKEIPWKSGEVIAVDPATKPRQPPRPPKGFRQPD
jgi:hypothetical protein